MTERTQPDTAAAPLVDLVDGPRPSFRQRLSSKSVAPWVFIAPVLAFGLVFFLLPLGYAAFISLTRWNSLTPPKWVGLSNYEYLLFTDPRFWDTFWNTIYFAAGTLVIGIPLALVLAYAFTRAWGQAFWRSIYWLPYVTNVVAVAYIWQFLLDDSFGLVNRALGLVGLPGPGWLTDPLLAISRLAPSTLMLPLPLMVSSCRSGWAPPTLARMLTGRPSAASSRASRWVSHSAGSSG